MDYSEALHCEEDKNCSKVPRKQFHDTEGTNDEHFRRCSIKTQSFDRTPPKVSKNGGRRWRIRKGWYPMITLRMRWPWGCSTGAIPRGPWTTPREFSPSEGKGEKTDVKPPVRSSEAIQFKSRFLVETTMIQKGCLGRPSYGWQVDRQICSARDQIQL